MRQVPISTEKLEPYYIITPKTSTATSFNFVDPLAHAIAQGSEPSESLQLSGIKIKVIGNSIPSAVQATHIAYERLGFGSIELTADGNVAQVLLDKKLAKNEVDLFLLGTVVIEVTDLSP